MQNAKCDCMGVRCTQGAVAESMVEQRNGLHIKEDGYKSATIMASPKEDTLFISAP